MIFENRPQNTEIPELVTDSTAGGQSPLSGPTKMFQFCEKSIKSLQRCTSLLCTYCDRRLSPRSERKWGGARAENFGSGRKAGNPMRSPNVSHILQSTPKQSFHPFRIQAFDSLETLGLIAQTKAVISTRSVQKCCSYPIET